MLPARIDPKAAMVATASGAPWKCTDVPAGLFDVVMPAGSTQAALIEAAKKWIHAERAATNAGASGAFAAQRAPRRTIGPADASRMEPALLAARGELPPSEHADACFHCVHMGLTNGWDAAVGAERAHLVRLRHTAPARAKLAAFLNKS
jgi:hypothetical protein